MSMINHFQFAPTAMAVGQMFYLLLNRADSTFHFALETVSRVFWDIPAAFR